MVGRDLISAAAVRAQISQIEQYQTAVNTFRGKYSYLPGDIPEPDASKFGFSTRGSLPGQGDGDGFIASYITAADDESGVYQANAAAGETAWFWSDLSQAKLIDKNFTLATTNYYPCAGSCTGSTISGYLPKSKLGDVGYIYVWSGGWNAFSGGWMGADYPGDGYNYFAITGVQQIFWGASVEIPILSASQAYAIDRKMDDGLPQLGNIIAYTGLGWAGTSATHYYGQGDTASHYKPVLSVSDVGTGGVLQGDGSCYDARSTTSGQGTVPEQYSTEVNGGSRINCWLSIRIK